MQSWFENLAGTTNGPVLMWIFIIIGLLVVILGILWFIRHAASGTFVAGGRNRKPRLAVLDAAAVDSRRRLVLVRRDDVEHLIMIGGPSDIVVEQGIRRQRSSATEIAEPTGEQQANASSTQGSGRATVSDKRAAEVAHDSKPISEPVKPPVSPPAQAVKTTAQSEPVAQATRFSVSPGERMSTSPNRDFRLPDDKNTTSDQRSDPPLEPTVPESENRASEREPASAHKKRDIHEDLLAELEATLDSTRPPKMSGANTDIDETMSKMLSDVSRHHR